MIAVADCNDAREVMLRVLGKFHKANTGSEKDDVESWGLFRSNDEHGKLGTSSYADFIFTPSMDQLDLSMNLIY